ncbi:hypothetical protein JCM10212_001426 [Sporobolomyces blumeae]
MPALLPSRDELPVLGPAIGALGPALLLALYLSRPSRSLNLTVLPLFLATALYTSLAYTTGSAADDYGRATLNFVLALKAVEAFLLTRPSFEVAFRKTATGSIPEPWSLARLGWAIKVMTSLRGAGWSWQVRGVPPTRSPPPSRSTFVKSRLARVVYLYLSMDAVSTYMQTRPYFHRQVALVELSFVERVVNMASACLAGGLAMTILHNAVSAICVATTWWGPEECPDMIGDWKQATSLSGFWGKVWHQSFRRPFTSIARFVVSAVPLVPPTSRVARFSILCLAFLQSGLLHAFSAYAMARTGMGSIKFFAVQPFGIVVEAFVSKRTSGLGSRTVRNACGYVWVATWLVYWCPSFYYELVQAGMWEVDLAPLSVVKGIWKGQWLNLPP